MKFIKFYDLIFKSNLDPGLFLQLSLGQIEINSIELIPK